MKLIFVTGGVVSSLGKGIVTASLASLLRSRGIKLKIRKLDPYLNVDPGTMSPYQHGEVYVTDDGYETDLDLGHYERFTDITCSKNDSISSGKIYSSILSKERKGEYLGSTVQVIPHVTEEIKNYSAISSLFISVETSNSATSNLNWENFKAKSLYFLRPKFLMRLTDKTASL